MFDKVLVTRCDELPSGAWTPGDAVELSLDAAIKLIESGAVKAPLLPRFQVPAEWRIGAGQVLEEEEVTGDEITSPEPKKVFRRKKVNGND